MPLRVMARQELRRNLGSVAAVLVLLLGYSLNRDKSVSYACRSSEVVAGLRSKHVEEYSCDRCEELRYTCPAILFRFKGALSESCAQLSFFHNQSAVFGGMGGLEKKSNPACIMTAVVGMPSRVRTLRYHPPEGDPFYVRFFFAFSRRNCPRNATPREQPWRSPF